MPERATLVWRGLGPDLHIAEDGERIAVVLYAVEAWENDRASAWLEFWCLLTGPPIRHEVLFGVAAGTGEAWEDRWERGRAAAEYVYFDWLSSADPE